MSDIIFTCSLLYFVHLILIVFQGYYTSLFGSESVEMIKDSNVVAREKLDPSKVYIQACATFSIQLTRIPVYCTLFSLCIVRVLYVLLYCTVHCTVNILTVLRVYFYYTIGVMNRNHSFLFRISCSADRSLSWSRTSRRTK